MYIAEIKDIMGATFRFASSNYKWVYKQALSFCKDIIHRYPDQGMIVFAIGDTLIFVTRNFIGIDAEWNNYYRLLERGE